MKYIFLFLLLIGCSSSSSPNLREEKCQQLNDDIKACRDSYCQLNPNSFACVCWNKDMSVSSTCKSCINKVDYKTQCSQYEMYGDRLEDYDGFHCSSLFDEVKGVCED
jgi:hypothetical protein